MYTHIHLEESTKTYAFVDIEEHFNTNTFKDKNAFKVIPIYTYHYIAGYTFILLLSYI